MSGSTRRVFSDCVRTDSSPGGHSASTAAFLDRVAGTYWDQVRDLIERWVADLPDGARPDVIGRLRDSSYAQFGGAFWELYLYQTFTRSGYAVTIDPEVEGSARQPDFLVENDEDTFYVEAKALISNAGDMGAAARKTRLYDALNKVDCANFFLRIDVNKVGLADLQTKPLRRALENWISALDPDVVSKTGYVDSSDPFRWAAAGWELEFWPIPVKPERRGKKDHRPLGWFGPATANWVNDDGTFRSALHEKGSAYGPLNRPLVVAVNSFALTHDDFDTMNALYGTEQITISIEDPHAPPVTSRKPDGYWFAGTWAHQHVAGVLLSRSMAPWRVAVEFPTYWQHPQSQDDVSPLRHWRVAEVVVDQVQYRQPSLSPSTLFGLTAPWPAGEPFPREASP